MDRRDSREYSSDESFMDRLAVEREHGVGRDPKRQTFFGRACGLQSQWRWALDTGLLVAVIILLMQQRQLLARTSAGSASAGHRAVETQVSAVAGDITGWTPEFATQVVQFRPDPDFVPQNASQFFSERTAQKWLDLVPKGLGYQVINRPETLDDLPTPLPEFFPQTVFTTSMTHQLHCLYALAEVYAAYSSDRQKVKVDSPWHVAHCVDYLRQAIMCAGDVALEGTQTTFPDGVEGSDGWDARHVCRDYGQIYRHLEENRATDEKWI